MTYRQVGSRTSSLARHLAIALIASLAAVGMVSTVGAAQALAADDQLRETVVATYRLDPPKGVVHVTLDITVTNVKPDTATTIYYFDTLGYAIQARAVSVKATSNGATLSARATPKDFYTDVKIRMPNLYHDRTRRIALTYDLPGGAPRSESPIRVGRAHAEFSAWAWGDPERADIRIVIPDSFSGEVEVHPDATRDPLLSTSAGGLVTYSAKRIGAPDDWYALVNVSDRSALTAIRLDLAGKQVTVHAWPEDKDWLDKVSTVLEKGFPGLDTALGLPWPVEGELDVTEVSTGEIRGYAGIYDSIDDEIQISEDLDAHVIVHEAAHAWFDRDLFVQRWITEGLADEYASRVLDATGLSSSIGPSDVRASDKAAFRLNAWPPPSRIDDETQAAEDFGYDASWVVVRAIVSEVGEQRMRDVLDAATARTIAYVGAGPAESTTGVADWRRFLDLVEIVGGAKNASGLIEGWAVTNIERPELLARMSARGRYLSLLTRGDGWLPSIVIRKPMGDWAFSKAEVAMGEAEAVLVDRDRLNAATVELGLDVPTALEPAYESADSVDDLTELDARIDTWISATEPIRAARDALARERSPFVVLGLLGTQPETGYAAGLSAWAAGDDAGAVAGASATLAVLAGAGEVGRGRVVTVGLVVVAVMVVILLLAVAAVLLWRRAHRRPLAVAIADPASGGTSLAAVVGAEAVGAEGRDPYATLAATPDPVEGAEVGGDGGEGAQPD